MYQYTFDNNTTNSVADSTKKSKTIFEEFGEVDNKYNSLTNSSQNLNLEKMEYVRPTSKDVQEKAENSLEAYKNTSINYINQNFDEKNKNIDKSIEKAKQSGEKEKNEIVSAFSVAKQKAKDDAVKRGLARSSIIVNTLANYDQNMLGSLNSQMQELNQTISNFENEKSLLEEQKQSALSSFNIEYAVKLQDKINEINNNILEKEQEVIEYNNKIEETKAKWEKSQADSIYDKTMDIAKLMAEHGISVFEVLKQNEKYELAKKHLSQMDKDVAIAELTNNSNYKSHIGQVLYNKLLQELQSK